MQIYDTANRLAQEIREAEEYKNYKELKSKIYANPLKKEALEKFEDLRYKMQIAQMQGEKVEEEKQKEVMNNLQEQYAKLLEDEEIKKYFEAEIKFNVMIADVNKIIAEAIQDVL